MYTCIYICVFARVCLCMCVFVYVYMCIHLLCLSIYVSLHFLQMYRCMCMYSRITLSTLACALWTLSLLLHKCPKKYLGRVLETCRHAEAFRQSNSGGIGRQRAWCRWKECYWSSTISRSRCNNAPARRAAGLGLLEGHLHCCSRKVAKGQRCVRACRSSE